MALFEELAFKKKHVARFDELGTTSVVMEDENGFRVDVSQADTLPHDNRDVMSIRMNVSDYDEALELLTSHGFTNVLGDKLVNTGSAKGIMLKSPSGFIVNLVKHIKK